MGVDECHEDGQESLGDIFDEINLFEYLRHAEPTADEEAYDPDNPLCGWCYRPAPELRVRTRCAILRAGVTKARLMSCTDRESLERLSLPPWANEEIASELVRLAVWTVVAEAGEPGADHAWPPASEPEGDRDFLYPLYARDIRWEVEHLPGGGRTIHPGPMGAYTPEELFVIH